MKATSQLTRDRMNSRPFLKKGISVLNNKPAPPKKLPVVYKFSYKSAGMIIRDVVYRRDDGTYRIDQTFVQGSEQSTREDIHGVMDDKALLAWMSNALFNQCYTAASPEERKWMMKS